MWAATGAALLALLACGALAAFAIAHPKAAGVAACLAVAAIVAWLVIEDLWTYPRKENPGGRAWGPW
jgi:hypothetical protein